MNDYLYLHKKALETQSKELYQWIDSYNTDKWPNLEWNIAKLSLNKPIFSLLYYRDFREQEHPQLFHSIQFSITSGESRIRHYNKSDNRPILHRKETLLPPDDPDFPRFSTLTRAEVQAGLYEDPRRIGYLSNWLSLLRSKKIRIEDHRVKIDPTKKQRRN